MILSLSLFSKFSRLHKRQRVRAVQITFHIVRKDGLQLGVEHRGGGDGFSTQIPVQDADGQIPLLKGLVTDGGSHGAFSDVVRDFFIQVVADDAETAVHFGFQAGFGRLLQAGEADEDAGEPGTIFQQVFRFVPARLRRGSE